MKYVSLMIALVFVVIGSASHTNAQVVDKTKDAAEKAIKVTTDTAKKTSVVVTDTLGDAASKTKSATESAVKTTTTKAQTFGNGALLGGKLQKESFAPVGR